MVHVDTTRIDDRAHITVGRCDDDVVESISVDVTTPCHGIAKVIIWCRAPDGRRGRAQHRVHRHRVHRARGLHPHHQRVTLHLQPGRQRLARGVPRQRPRHRPGLARGVHQLCAVAEGPHPVGPLDVHPERQLGVAPWRRRRHRPAELHPPVQPHPPDGDAVVRVLELPGAVALGEPLAQAIAEQRRYRRQLLLCPRRPPGGEAQAKGQPPVGLAEGQPVV